MTGCFHQKRKKKKKKKRRKKNEEERKEEEIYDGKEGEIEASDPRPLVGIVKTRIELVLREDILERRQGFRPHSFVHVIQCDGHL